MSEEKGERKRKRKERGERGKGMKGKRTERGRKKGFKEIWMCKISHKNNRQTTIIYFRRLWKN
jgi:hypothetical protein